jgi:hypothetical protein
MKIKIIIPIIIILFFIFFGVVNAWTGPTTTPPAGNTSEPLNISNSAQTKAGYLSVPRLEDANNTGYYVDPASNSWLYRLYSYDVRADIFYDRNNTGYYLDPAGTSRLNDIRPSIMYDGDNTGYYVNPASTSNLNTLTLGTLNWIDSSCAAGSSIRAISSTGAVTCEIDDNTTIAEADTLDTVANRGNTTSNWIQSNSSVRAPLFYDSNNTGYYVDPAGMSNMERVDFSYGYDRNNTAYYIDLNNRTNLLSLTASGDIRSPIFYDQNNTGYYVDPASTSRMNAITPNSISLGGVSRTTWPSGCTWSGTKPVSLFCHFGCSDYGTGITCTNGVITDVVSSVCIKCGER